MLIMSVLSKTNISVKAYMCYGRVAKFHHRLKQL